MMLFLAHIIMMVIIAVFCFRTVALLRKRRPQNSMFAHVTAAVVGYVLQYLAVLTAFWVFGMMLGLPGGFAETASQALFGLALVLVFEYVKDRTGWIVLKMDT